MAEEQKVMDNKELFGRLLIGLAPQLIGAALGGARGGVAGGEAARTGLSALSEAERQEKEGEMKKLSLAQEKEKASKEEARKLEELGLKKQELALKKAEVGVKQEEKAKGKTITAEQSSKLAGIATSQQQLEEIQKEIDINSDIMGPIAGRITGLSPYAAQTKGFDARMKLAAQSIGVSLEGGKLTDEDIKRYRQMLPNLTDTPEAAREKIKVVNQLLEQRRESEIGSMSSGGYDVSRFSQQPAPQVEVPMKKSAGMKLPGATKEAFAEEKPRVVVQGGHTYVLNPKTGQYE